MEKLINYLKNIKKRAYINNVYRSKYAFIGIGNHSINNLFPVINYLRLELKYIVTQSEKNAKLIDENYSMSEGTNDIEKVLNDVEIEGVFISATPKSHFALVKKVLESGKNVFVEKPPCLTYDELEELIRIEKTSKGKCFVGLQKQYAPANIELKKQVKDKSSYNYRWVTGAYPEGDPFLDLFIHPISLVSFLFGEAELKYHSYKKSRGGITIFLQFQHTNGTIGIIELSSEYSWSNAQEKMIVNTEKGIFEVTNTEDLTFTPKQGTLLGVPKEKIFGDKMTTQILKKRNNFNPVFQNNQLYSSGYYTEIENFVKHCEKKKYIHNSSLESCINTFKIIKTIKEKLDVQ
ncbi:MAG: gfo/Idh/MocA family oxidoreductase [Bacteroidetes bacterium HGW-Bacteroidetes-21]|jgi:virulence factor|nr:MAG: gfo/Idh/MocA family oxidoreductase [Bacteroidetes bacterium HGW-Bacteroidetes-21]